jgi:hypothetical protein
VRLCCGIYCRSVYKSSKSAPPNISQCAPIKSFGKKHLEDVIPEVNTRESVAHWCGVDTRIGTLTCVLEENHCFDAEMYADDLQMEEQIDFREDHRSMYLRLSSMDIANRFQSILANGYCDTCFRTSSTRRSNATRYSDLPYSKKRKTAAQADRLTSIYPQ